MDFNKSENYSEVANLKIFIGQGKTDIVFSEFKIIEDTITPVTEEGKKRIEQIRSDIENLLNQYNKNLGGEINGMVGDNEETNITDHGQVINEEIGRKEKDIHNEQIKLATATPSLARISAPRGSLASLGGVLYILTQVNIC